MINNIISLLCLIGMIVEMFVVIVNIITKKRSERIKYIRSFKKGKCIVIFLLAIPLYIIGYMYSGTSFLFSFFNSINDVIGLVVLKYELGPLVELMNNNVLYKVTIYFTYVLVCLNAIMFTISLTSQYIWNNIQILKSIFTKKEKLYLFGNNENNISIYKSDKTRNKLIIDDLDNKACENLYRDNISYFSVGSFEGPIKRIFKRLRKANKNYIVIVNTENEEKNIKICKIIINYMKKLTVKEQDRLFRIFNVFVFGNPKNEAIYMDIMENGYGCIRYINKYQEIAMNFIDLYPLTQFMNEKQIDYETSLIKDNFNINVAFIGFGKTNREIFLASVANNQFLQGVEDKLKLKQVKYHIFDKDNAEQNKNLNHNYYRYKNECSNLIKEEYLPLPDIPAEEYYYHIDVNDSDFYNSLHSIFVKNENDINYLIIAFGTDLENMDMAQKLVEKRREWNLNNLIIFVKVRNWSKEDTLLEDEDCYFIGNEKKTVYNIKNITGDKILNMAQQRNEVYDLEYNITHLKDYVITQSGLQEIHDNSIKKWYKKRSQMERDSSLYCCLSLRSKLHLMGLDYVKEYEDGQALSEEEYLDLYAKDDLPYLDKNQLKADGKQIIKYTLDFKNSRRKTMAVLEHFRWNSFLISKGFIPAKKKTIIYEMTKNDKNELIYTNGRNYKIRRHGNLTTFEGLEEFRKLVSERDNTLEIENDVIKYDYQILDDAYWLLHKNGYKIIKRN